MELSETFAPPVESLLDQAESFCRHRGSRLTDIRRFVLGLVLSRDQPVGAYELLDHLKQANRSAAPPTIYRALDFLMEQGLIHRVERLSAFVGCRHALGHAHGCSDFHAAQFLICRTCKRVIELEDNAVSRALLAVGTAAGFRIIASTIEAEGVCERCDKANPANDSRCGDGPKSLDAASVQR